MAYVHGDAFLICYEQRAKRIWLWAMSRGHTDNEANNRKKQQYIVPLPDNSVTSSWIVQPHPPKVTSTPGLAKEVKGKRMSKVFFWIPMRPLKKRVGDQKKTHQPWPTFNWSSNSTKLVHNALHQYGNTSRPTRRGWSICWKTNQLMDNDQLSEILGRITRMRVSTF